MKRSVTRLLPVLRLSIFFVLLLISHDQGTFAQHPEGELFKRDVAVEEGEFWWFGITSQGDMMPLKDGFSQSIVDNNFGNQIQPLVISNQGRVIWSDSGFRLTLTGGVLKLTHGEAPINLYDGGETLKDAFKYASRNFFPPTGAMPDPLLFTAPQYNTWIELQYDQNQEDILKYAHAILDNGMPPGVLMIDDNWQEDYGKWDFHPGRFPDPKAMINELHGMGFKVMLWICPFVSQDCDVYRAAQKDRIFLQPPSDVDSKNSQPVSWWNGVSAVLDLSNPKAGAWFEQELDRLQNDYGVDGFKFDAGDTAFYKIGQPFDSKIGPNEQAFLFAKIGLDYPLNEYRACYKMGGQPLAQRLRDKGHSWDDLQRLVPQMINMGLMGYSFSCPDMIGGGDFTSFLPGAVMDQELIVRSAQVHALMPMMQFSVAPWRVLSDDELQAVKTCVQIRAKFSNYILATAVDSAKTGQPILRSLEYEFPNQGYETMVDQFMIGDRLLVAPVTRKGQTSVSIKLPPGSWKGSDGRLYKGGQAVDFVAGLDVLPYFERQ